MKTCFNPWCRALIGLALLVALVAPPVSAAEETQEAPAPTVASQVAAGEVSFPVTVAGMQVSIDPKTGRLRQPTPAEAKALAAAFQKAFAPNRLASKQTVVQKDANGMLTAQIDLSLLDQYVVEVQEDGTVVSRCVDGHSDTAPVHDHSVREEM